MTLVEVGLLTALVGVVGISGGRYWKNGKVVSKSLCSERMQSERELLEFKYDSIDRRLQSIEDKIDALKT